MQKYVIFVITIPAWPNNKALSLYIYIYIIYLYIYALYATILRRDFVWPRFFPDPATSVHRKSLDLESMERTCNLESWTTSTSCLNAVYHCALCHLPVWERSSQQHEGGGHGHKMLTAESQKHTSSCLLMQGMLWLGTRGKNTIKVIMHMNNDNSPIGVTIVKIQMETNHKAIITLCFLLQTLWWRPADPFAFCSRPSCDISIDRHVTWFITYFARHET